MTSPSPCWGSGNNLASGDRPERARGAREPVSRLGLAGPAPELLVKSLEGPAGLEHGSLIRGTVVRSFPMSRAESAGSLWILAIIVATAGLGRVEAGSSDQSGLFCDTLARKRRRWGNWPASTLQHVHGG